MKNAVRASLVLGVVASLGAAGVFAACGDDTTNNAPLDGGGRDSTTSFDAAGDGAAAGDSSGDDGGCFTWGPLDDAAVAAGQAIVKSHRCQSCHGSQLSGNNDGVMSPQTEGGLAYPPNLTPDPTTGLGCWTNDEVVHAILDGIDDQGMALCPPMPRFGHLADGGLDAATALQVVEYLRSLHPVMNQVPDTPSCTVPGDDGGDGGMPESSTVDAPADGPTADAPGDGPPDSPADSAPDSPSDAPDETSPPDASTQDAPGDDGSAEASPDADLDAAQDATPDGASADAGSD